MSRPGIHASWRPYIVLVLGVLAVSSASVMIRFAQAETASSLVIAAWRLGLAVLILTPIVFARHRTDLARLTRREIGLALLSGAFLSVHFASWITSLEYTSVISSIVLVSTSPLWVAFLAPLVLRERLSRVTLIGILIAIGGGCLVSVGGSAGSAPHQDNPLLGNALALIGAATVAGYFIIGRRLRSGVPLMPYIWLTYGSAAILLCLAVLVTGQPVAGLPADAYVWMTLVGLFPQLIGHSAYNYALGYLSAAYVSLTVLSEPISGTLLAALFLGEQPGALQLIGSALIMLALVIASREEAQTASRVCQQAVVTG
jgi:drug/metabolite transporter (DMT)-like permease